MSVSAPTRVAPDPGFRLRGLLRTIRWGLVLTIVLITGDALSSIALPALVRQGLDAGVGAGAPGVLRSEEHTSELSHSGESRMPSSA